MSNEIVKSENGNLANKPLNNKLSQLKSNFEAMSKGLAEIEIPRLFHQLVIFVLDASDSMTWEGMNAQSKGEDVKDQIIPILERLKQSKNKNCFDISMWAFSKDTKEFLSLRSVADIEIDKFDFNPCSHINNYGTNIYDTFIGVEAKIHEYLNKNIEKQCKVLVLVLSDGDISDIDKVTQITDRLKAIDQVTISSYLFEDKQWKENLDNSKLQSLRDNIKSFASSSNDKDIVFFKSTIDPEEIRKHMIKSISTVSKID